VLVQTPVYPPIYTASEKTGLQRQECELQRDASGAYQIDFDAFEAAFTPDTRLFILCNPHNPVGRLFTRAELERIAEICLRKGVLICSDEIHSDLVFSGQRHIPIASLDAEIARSTITLISATKTYNIAGLKCAYAVIQDPTLKERYEAARKGLVGGVNLVGMVATLAAYRDGQEWLDQLLVYLEANRDYLHRRIRQDFPGVVMGLPEATYLAWLDFRGSQIGENPCQFMDREARVGLNEGTIFGPPGEGFARLNFGCPRSLLAEALDRMARVYPRE
jgi:cystathionine beta-lyase